MACVSASILETLQHCDRHFLQFVTKCLVSAVNTWNWHTFYSLMQLLDIKVFVQFGYMHTLLPGSVQYIVVSE